MVTLMIPDYLNNIPNLEGINTLDHLFGYLSRAKVQSSSGTSELPTTRPSPLLHDTHFVPLYSCMTLVGPFLYSRSAPVVGIVTYTDRLSGFGKR